MTSPWTRRKLVGAALGAVGRSLGVPRFGLRSDAAVTLSILPVLARWIVGQKWFVEGIAMTGMKS